MEELFGFEDGVVSALDFAELLNSILEYFDFLERAKECEGVVREDPFLL